MRVEKDRPPTSYFAFVVCICLGVFLYLGWILGGGGEMRPDQQQGMPGSAYPAVVSGKGLVLRAENSTISNVQGLYADTGMDQPLAMVSDSGKPADNIADIAKSAQNVTKAAGKRPAIQARVPVQVEGKALYSVSEPDIYIVRPNDTLTGIAKRRLGSAKRWREISRLNAHILSNPHSLKPGLRLRLPCRHTFPVAAKKDRAVKYIVKEADSLYSLAVRFYASPSAVDVIRQANTSVLKDGTTLRPGMELDIPSVSYSEFLHESRSVPRRGTVTYTICEGDTLSEISKKFYNKSTEYGHILKANKQIKNAKTLRVGAVIVIPPAPAKKP